MGNRTRKPFPWGQNRKGALIKTIFFKMYDATFGKEKDNTFMSTNTTSFNHSYLRNYASDQNLQTSLIGRIAKSKHCKIVRYKRIQLHSKMNF